MPSQTSRLFIALLLCALIPACGGSSEARPGPLAAHLDEMHIARVPLAEKQAVLEARNEYEAARMEHANAQALYNESATDVEVASNERAQAVLDERSAQSRKKAADESGDMNRVNAESRDLRAAKLGLQAADKKVAYMQARRKYLKKKVLQAEDAMYAKEARFELSKARLAKAKNIRPKDFSLAKYEEQAQERSRYAQRTESELQRDKAAVETLRKEWQALRSEAKRARGATGSSTGSSSDSSMSGSSKSNATGGASNPP